MNSFEAIGQAKLDAAEGQRQMSHAFAGWLGRIARRWFRAATQHRPGSRVMPW